MIQSGPRGEYIAGDRTWLGLAATPLEYGKAVRVTATPDRVFYAQKIAIASSCARALVMSITFAGVELLAAPGGVPAELFPFEQYASAAFLYASPRLGPDAPATLDVWFPPAETLTRAEHCRAFKLHDRARFLWVRRLRSWVKAYVLRQCAPAPLFSGAIYGSLYP